jgi:hypothetical protein
MPSSALRSLRALWEETFGPCLTAPGFANFIVVASGWLLTQGTHAVTEALVATNVAARAHHEAFHRFFSRGTWDPDTLGRWLFWRIRDGLCEAGIVRAAIDDTFASKKGTHVFGIGSHLDAVRSTRKRKVFAFGHCWVSFAVLVRVPFSSRTWALPVLFRLYRTVKECERSGATHRKKTDLAREMLDVFCTWVPDRRIELTADSAYCNDTVTCGLPERVVLFGAMRPDAVLTEPPPSPTRSEKGGRPRKRGRLLRKPKQIARDGRTPWQTSEATLYGRKTTVRYKTVCAQWYRATGTRLLRIVIVATDSGSIPTASSSRSTRRSTSEPSSKPTPAGGPSKSSFVKQSSCSASPTREPGKKPPSSASLRSSGCSTRRSSSGSPSMYTAWRSLRPPSVPGTHTSRDSASKTSSEPRSAYSSALRFLIHAVFPMTCINCLPR